MFPSNPSVSTELWSVLAKLPYQIRYGLYGSSRLAGLEKGATRTSPRTKSLPVIEAEVNTGIDVRYTLKRLSKDNIKDMGRQLSKISHSNPIVVFTTILNQIESYDNLIQMMVDTFIHVTELSLDVLGYCLLVALGGGDSKGGRSKLKEDGVNAAQWLSSLEDFAGAFYKKFPNVEMQGLLSYLVRRLEQGEILELGVLRTLLKTAGSYGFADCESTAGLSETQLDGRAGSQQLKRETSDFGIVEKFNRKASIKLRSVLQDHDVGVVILILLSQIRSRIIYQTGNSTPKHIKLIGSRYDSCQMVLSVLIDFLTDTTEDQNLSSGSISCYASALPELSELHQSFGLEPSIAWMLCRPLIRAAMFEQEEKEAVPPNLEPYLPHTESMRTTSAAMLPEVMLEIFDPGSVRNVLLTQPLRYPLSGNEVQNRDCSSGQGQGAPEPAQKRWRCCSGHDGVYGSRRCRCWRYREGNQASNGLYQGARERFGASYSTFRHPVCRPEATEEAL